MKNDNFNQETNKMLFDILTKVENIEKKTEKIEEKVENIEEKVKELEGKVDDKIDELSLSIDEKLKMQNEYLLKNLITKQNSMAFEKIEDLLVKIKESGIDVEDFDVEELEDRVRKLKSNLDEVKDDNVDRDEQKFLEKVTTQNNAKTPDELIEEIKSYKELFSDEAYSEKLIKMIEESKADITSKADGSKDNPLQEIINDTHKTDEYGKLIVYQDYDNSKLKNNPNILFNQVLFNSALLDRLDYMEERILRVIANHHYTQLKNIKILDTRNNTRGEKLYKGIRKEIREGNGGVRKEIREGNETLYRGMSSKVDDIVHKHTGHLISQWLKEIDYKLRNMNEMQKEIGELKKLKFNIDETYQYTRRTAAKLGAIQ